MKTIVDGGFSIVDFAGSSFEAAQFLSG